MHSLSRENSRVIGGSEQAGRAGDEDAHHAVSASAARRHRLLLRLGQLAVDRQRERRPAARFGVREVAAAVAERREAFLEVERHRIVDLGADARARSDASRTRSRSGTRTTYWLKMWRYRGSTGSVHAPRGRPREQLVVASGVGAAHLGPAREVRQLHPQHRGLQRVEPEVAADALVEVFRLGAVVAQQPDFVRQRARRWSSPARRRRTRRGSCSGRTRSSPTVPIVPACRPLIGRADRLRGILDHRDRRLRGDVEQRIHVGALAVEVDRDDRLGPRRDRGAHRAGSMLNVTGSMSTSRGVGTDAA